MARTYTQLLVHVVFSTHDRLPSIPRELRAGLFAYIFGVVCKAGGHLVIVDGVDDHIHLLISLRARMAVSSLVARIKNASRRWLRDHGVRGFRWQEGFSGFSVSHSHRDRVVAYIAAQEGRHRTISSREELRLLLEKHDLAIEEEYFE